jgi:predicted anti-sigma-YlaC factor YlaD
VDCNASQERLSLLLDGEAPALEQAEMFAHLGVCPGCRDWFDTLTTVRRTALRDRDEIAHGADDLLLPRVARREVRRLPARPFGRVWRLPVPMAAALAVLLLAGGALLGARWPLLAGEMGRGLAGRNGSAVVVVCSLPGVTVLPEGGR